MSPVKIVGRGIDTLVLNVSYADKHFQPIKSEVDLCADSVGWDVASTNWLEAFVSRAVGQNARPLLGHETWDMIEVYVRLAEQDKRELYTKFSPLDSLDMHHSVKGRRERAREWRNTRKQKRD